MLIDKLTLIGVAVAGVVGFGSGAYVTINHYEAKIAKQLKETADEISRIQESNQIRLAKVIGERDDASSRLADLDSRNHDLTARLHELSGRLSVPAVRPVISYEKEYDRCRKLLSESYEIIIEKSELLTEGCRKFGKCAADKDAIAGLVIEAGTVK